MSEHSLNQVSFSTSEILLPWQHYPYTTLKIFCSSDNGSGMEKIRINFLFTEGNSLSRLDHEDLYRLPTEGCQTIFAGLLLLLGGKLVSVDYLIYYLCGTLTINFNRKTCTPSHLCSYLISQ